MIKSLKADLYWREWNKSAKLFGINHDLTRQLRKLYDQHKVLIINGKLRIGDN